MKIAKFLILMGILMLASISLVSAYRFSAYPSIGVGGAPYYSVSSGGYYGSYYGGYYPYSRYYGYPYRGYYGRFYYAPTPQNDALFTYSIQKSFDKQPSSIEQFFFN